jgi:hypothetical protein
MPATSAEDRCEMVSEVLILQKVLSLIYRFFSNAKTRSLANRKRSEFHQLGAESQF